MAKLRDKLWIWGQSPNSHYEENNNHYNFPCQSRMTAAEGAYYLGVSNCCRVVMDNKPIPPFDQESMALEPLKQVVWSITGSFGSARNNDGWGDLNEVVRQAKLYPNITGAVLDDFFMEKRMQVFTSERLKEIKDKLCIGAERNLDLWVVLYEFQLELPVKNHLDNCDVTTFWTWKGSELNNLDKNFEKVKSLTPAKRRLAGCYMWNYGEKKPLTMDLMKMQCEKYYQWLKKGDIEGIIFCSNCIADMGLDTVKWTRNWIKEIAEEQI